MNDLKEWLAAHGLADYHDLFVRHRIDLDVIADLDDRDLAALEVPVGDRIRLRRALAAASPSASASEARDGAAAVGAFAEAAATPPQAGPPHRSGAAAAGERRLLTLMFVDLIGSTKLSRSLDLDDFRETIRQFQECCARTIRSFGGHVAQYRGDGALAYFGFPAAGEDDAVNAALAGLAIVEEVSRLTVPAPGPLEVRVGIATGDVFVGDLAQDWTADAGGVLGDAANLAARIEALASPGAVLVCPDTHELIASSIDCTALGPTEVRDFAGPMAIWQVAKEKGGISRFEARLKGRLSPFVGRDNELMLFEQLWQAAKGGKGQVLAISGEAGIGKSRLTRECIARIEDEAHFRLSFQCLPNHEGSALHPVVRHLRQVARIAPEDADQTAREKLAAVVESAGGDVAARLALFAHLLSIPTENRHPHLRQPAHVVREHTIRALLDQIEGLARRKPVLMVVEDVHWIDPSTHEVLDRLIEEIEALPVLVMLTSRRQDPGGWSGTANVTMLPLSPLGRRTSREMLLTLTSDVTELSAEIIDTIVQRSQGVPFFLEEMARVALMQRSADPSARLGEGGDGGLPMTLRGLLSAQLDTLPVPRRVVALCAAMLGEFTPKLVAAASKLDLDRLRPMLDEMAATQLIVIRGRWPDCHFRFRHILLQDIAYQTMLAGQRRAVHKSIAAALQAVAADLIEALPELLAYHLERAGEFAAARDQWRRAGLRAIERYANAEAISHFEAALKANAALGRGDDIVAMEITLRSELRLPLERHSWGSDAIAANLERLFELQVERGDDHAIFELLHGLFGCHLIRGDPGSAFPYCARMQALAERTGDPSMQAMATHKYGMCFFMLGDFDAAVDAFDRCLRLREATSAEAIRRYYAPDPWAVALAMRAWALGWRHGDRPETQSAIDTAQASLTGLTDAFSRCFVLSILASICQTLERPLEALAHATAATEASRESDLPYWDAWGRIIHGWSRVVGRGEPDGIDELKAGIEAYGRTGSRQIIPYAQLLLADVHLRVGRPRLAHDVLEEVDRLEATLTVRFHAPLKARLRQRVAAALEATPNGAPE